MKTAIVLELHTQIIRHTKNKAYQKTFQVQTEVRMFCKI
jgi:DNA-binding FadR family transcriptional regulator